MFKFKRDVLEPTVSNSDIYKCPLRPKGFLRLMESVLVWIPGLKMGFSDPFWHCRDLTFPLIFLFIFVKISSEVFPV